MDKLTKSILALISLVLFAGIAYLFLRKTEGFEGGETPVIVYYFLPQCGWCKKFSPTWEEFVAKAEKVPIKTLKLDASKPENEKRVEKHGIKGFPHVQMEKGEQAKPFEGERTVDALMKFAKSA